MAAITCIQFALKIKIKIKILWISMQATSSKELQCDRHLCDAWSILHVFHLHSWSCIYEMDFWITLYGKGLCQNTKQIKMRLFPWRMLALKYQVTEIQSDIGVSIV